MEIYTIEERIPLAVSEGTEVKKFKLLNGVTIDTVQVGESGRGRNLAVIPVQLLSPWDGDGERIIKNVRLGQTQKGAPKFFEIPTDGDADEDIILVCRTPIGFRGGNKHFFLTGKTCDEDVFFDVVGGAQCAKCLWYTKEKLGVSHQTYYFKYPHTEILEIRENHRIQVLAIGQIAQGLAGRMGCGNQYILKTPVPFEFKIAVSGRLYDAPGDYIIKIEKTGVSVITPEEEALL